MSSTRNKTIQVSSEEREELSQKILIGYSEDIIDKIICGDCLKLLDDIPNEFFDIIFLDPPYNISKQYGDSKFGKKNDEAYRKWVESWMVKVVSKLKQSGSLYCCCDWRCSYIFHEVLSKYLVVKNRISWKRDKGRGAKKNWKNNCEDIFFCVANPDNYFFDVEAVKVRKEVIAPYRQDGVAKDWKEDETGRYRMTYPSNIWTDLVVPFWSMAENTPHPTQKPEKLLERIILASCPKGGIVFDPFLGSGTSAVVAKRLDRNFVGIEKEMDYCLIAQKRLIAQLHGS